MRADPTNAPTAPPRARWGVEQFAAFWRAPNFALPSDELAGDVRGYWPGQATPREGIAAYAKPLRLLLQWVPDFRLDVAEHAENGDDTFIRWIARGTWRGAPLVMTGVDRVRQRDGQVVENRIFCRHPLIDALLAAVDRD